MHALGSWCERYRSGTGARQSDRSSLWIKTRSALRLYFARSAPRSLHAPLTCSGARTHTHTHTHTLFMFTVGLTASTWSHKQLAQPHRLGGMHCSGLMSWGACLDNQANLRPFSSLLQSPQVVPTSHSNLCAQHDGQCAPQPLTPSLVNMRQSWLHWKRWLRPTHPTQLLELMAFMSGSKRAPQSLACFWQKR